MNFFRSLCAICAITTSATTAWASDWQYVTSDTAGTDVYVDKESVRTKSTYNSNGRTAWIKWDFKKNNTKKEREAKILFEFDCNNYKSGIISFATYNPNGAVIDSYSVPYPQLTPDVPDTIGYSTLEFVCSL